MDSAYPNANLYLWPVPDVAYTLRLTSQKPFSRFVNLTDAVSFPPGYSRAIRYNLALELAQYSAALPPAVADIARESLMLLKIANARTTTLQNDPAVLSDRHGRTNIYSNTF